jgi:hypothetical protein
VSINRVEDCSMRRVYYHRHVDAPVWSGGLATDLARERRTAGNEVGCLPTRSRGVSLLADAQRGSCAVRSRADLLSGELFHPLREAQFLIEHWRHHYLAVRAHRSPGGRPAAAMIAFPAFSRRDYAPQALMAQKALAPGRRGELFRS